ncbi:hypothetical protein D9M70_393520 [compost metagenome]
MHVDLFRHHPVVERGPGAQVEQGEVAPPVLPGVGGHALVVFTLDGGEGLQMLDFVLEQSREGHLPLDVPHQAVLAEEQALLGQVDLIHDVEGVQRSLRVHGQDEVDMEGAPLVNGASDARGQLPAEGIEHAVLERAQAAGDPALAIVGQYAFQPLDKGSGLLARFAGNLVQFGPVQPPDVLLLQGLVEVHALDQVLAQAAGVAQGGHRAGERIDLVVTQFPFFAKLALEKLVLDVEKLLGAGDGLPHGLQAVVLHALLGQARGQFVANTGQLAPPGLLLGEPGGGTTQHLHAHAATGRRRCLGHQAGVDPLGLGFGRDDVAEGIRRQPRLDTDVVGQVVQPGHHRRHRLACLAPDDAVLHRGGVCQVGLLAIPTVDEVAAEIIDRGPLDAAVHVLPGHARLVGRQGSIVGRCQGLRLGVEERVGLLVFADRFPQQSVQQPEAADGQFGYGLHEALGQVVEALAADQGEHLPQFGFAHPALDQQQAAEVEAFTQVVGGAAQGVDPLLEVFPELLVPHLVQVVDDQAGQGADQVDLHPEPGIRNGAADLADCLAQAVAGAAHIVQSGQHGAGEKVRHLGDAIEGGRAAGQQGHLERGAFPTLTVRLKLHAQ